MVETLNSTFLATLIASSVSIIFSLWLRRLDRKTPILETYIGYEDIEYCPEDYEPHPSYPDTTSFFVVNIGDAPAYAVEAKAKGYSTLFQTSDRIRPYATMLPRLDPGEKQLIALTSATSSADNRSKSITFSWKQPPVRRSKCYTKDLLIDG